MTLDAEIEDRLALALGAAVGAFLGFSLGTKLHLSWPWRLAAALAGAGLGAISGLDLPTQPLPSVFDEVPSDMADRINTFVAGSEPRTVIRSRSLEDLPVDPLPREPRLRRPRVLRAGGASGMR